MKHKKKLAFVLWLMYIFRHDFRRQPTPPPRKQLTPEEWIKQHNEWCEYVNGTLGYRLPWIDTTPILVRSDGDE